MSETPKKKKRWWKRRWVVLFLWMPVVVIGSIGVLVWALGWNAKTKWEATQAKLDEWGEVLELEAYLPGEIPDEQNVLRDPWFLDLVDRAEENGGLHAVFFNIDKLAGTSDGHSYIEYEWNGPDPGVGRMLVVAQDQASLEKEENLEAARRLLSAWEDNEGMKEELDRVLEMSHMVGELDEESELAYAVPDRVSERLSLCRFCLRIGLMYGMTGDADEAIAYIERAENVKNWQSGRRTMDILARSACSTVIQHAVWQLMVTYRNDAGVLDKLGLIIDRALSEENMLTTAIRAEVAYLLEMHRSFGAGEWEEAMFTFSSTAGKWMLGQIMATDFVNYRSMNKKVMLIIPHVRDYESGSTDMPPGVLMERMEESYYDFLNGENKLMEVFNQLSTMGLSSIPVLAKNLIEERAGWRIARVQLAIARYRLENGKKPEGFDDLVGAYLKQIPKDPFDGQALRWKLDEEGNPLVYSIGRDLEDNEGVLGLEGNYGDLGWLMTEDTDDE